MKNIDLLNDFGDPRNSRNIYYKISSIIYKDLKDMYSIALEISFI